MPLHTTAPLSGVGIFGAMSAPADGAENEITAFCFTMCDPTNGQPGKPKLSSEIGAMLANVRPNCRISGCWWQAFHLTSDFTIKS